MSFCLATYIFLILRTSDNMQDDWLQLVVNQFLKIVGARQPKPILLLTHGNGNRSLVATVGQSGPVTGFFSVQQPDFGTLHVHLRLHSVSDHLLEQTDSIHLSGILLKDRTPMLLL